jgi:hypothetical protein
MKYKITFFVFKFEMSSESRKRYKVAKERETESWEMIEQYRLLCKDLNLQLKQCCNCKFMMASVVDDMENPLRWWNCAICYRYLCCICANITAEEKEYTTCICRKCGKRNE